MNNQNKNPLRWLIFVTVFIAITIVTLWVNKRFEREKPNVDLQLIGLKIGKSQNLSLTVSDEKSGVRKVWIGFIKRNKETVLYQKDFSQVTEDDQALYEISIPITFEPKKLGIGDGPAVLRIAVRDCSWWRWFHGNLNTIEKEVIIDTQPPIVKMLTRSHNLSPGGSGCAIYTLSETCRRSGVCVGDNFFPGHSGYFEDQEIYMVFFAVKPEQSQRTQMFLCGTDQAGNTTKKRFSKYVKKKEYKKETIKLTELYLKNILHKFEQNHQIGRELPLPDRFVYINNRSRKESLKIFEKLSSQTEKKLLWKGAFTRLPKSATKTTFGINREYKYNGRVIDTQTHWGVDLASVKETSVPAANSGKVVFAGPLNIYGQTIVIDHGFGLMSTYSHLSHVSTQVGQEVVRGDIVGRTGETGLSSGDHLHYGMYIHNTFVNPVEWWDADWLKNNITGKIEDTRLKGK